MQQFAQMGFPEMYERALVQPLFQPFAEHIVRAGDIAPGERALDIACGTGIVARLARRLAGDGRVVGVDVNPAMLGIAAAVAPDIEWRTGDAAALPVPDDEHFDVVFCQQGLQFFPDRSAAVAEMHRVLAVPGGRLAVSTWRSDEEMPVLLELRRIAEKHLGAVADRRHSFPDEQQLGELVQSAGFRDVSIETVARTIHFVDGNDFIVLNAMALVGMSPGGKDLSPDDRSKLVEAVVADSQRVLAAHSDAAGFAFDIAANVATASR